MEIKLEIEIEFLSPLNIGVGELPGLPVDRPTAKISQNPYIPASSLKGRIRDSCEQLAKALGYLICVSPDPSFMCTKEPCLICSIFGSPWHKAQVWFEDALPKVPNSVKFQNRFGVALSRLRQTAYEEKLFSAEIVQGTPTFVTYIGGELNETQLKLLLGGIQLVSTLGAASSRGLGWCKLKITKLVVDGKESPIDEFCSL